MSEYTVVYGPDSNEPGFSFRPLLVSIRGLTCTMVSLAQPGRDYAEYAGTMFTLPPPSTTLWATNNLQRLSMANPDDLSRRLERTVASFVCTHARICRAGVPTVAIPHEVIPLSSGSYVLKYPVLAGDLRLASEYGVNCAVCKYGWAEHTDDVCPGYLGETFTSENVRYDQMYDVLKFHHQLPNWLQTQADAIYKLAVEGAANDPTLEASPRPRTRRVASQEPRQRKTQGPGAPGAGPRDTVSGEPGDHRDR